MWINRMLMMIKNSRRERIASRAREEEIMCEKDKGLATQTCVLSYSSYLLSLIREY